METLRYIGSRFLQSLFALFCVLTLTFFLANGIPGSAFTDEKNVPPHLEELMKKKYGFDKPIGYRYLIYLKGLVTFDLGPSFANKGFSVREVIAQSWPVSMRIGLFGLLIALCIGIPFGVFAAANVNTRIDYILMSIALIGICLPTFVIGPLLGEFLGIKLNLFDVAGPSAWVMASLTLGLYYSAYIARLTRGSMLDVLSQDFIRTATAKGVSRIKVLFKHAFRGGIGPVVNYIGPALASILAGSFVVENIFGIPGLGQHFIKAVTNRDTNLMLATVGLFSTVLLAMNFLMDVVMVWLDPRTKLNSK